jgi:hypothetical protein
LAATNVPVKTQEAVAELASRQRKLSQRHRTVLLFVDGRRDEAKVREMALQAGAPDTCFDELVAQGMIDFVLTTPPKGAPAVASAAPAQAPLDVLASPDSVVSSMLPPSLTLQPSLNDSILNEPPSTDMGALDSQIVEGQDEVLEEARMILIRAVRAESPVAGALTLLRLRRARSREELESMLDEVELRITKPFKGLWATQTMSRVRELLSTQAVA